jgi:ketosteroid isomerase-like protein
MLRSLGLADLPRCGRLCCVPPCSTSNPPYPSRLFSFSAALSAKSAASGPVAVKALQTSGSVDVAHPAAAGSATLRPPGRSVSSDRVQTEPRRSLAACWPPCHRLRMDGSTGDNTSSVHVVLSYIEASQRARASGRAEDFEALREFLAADVVTKVASPWTDKPWQVMQRGADAIVTRLQAPINKATSLTTENVTVQRAGDDVYVEQLSTIVDGDGAHVSERGIPAG